LVSSFPVGDGRACYQLQGIVPNWARLRYILQSPDITCTTASSCPHIRWWVELLNPIGMEPILLHLTQFRRIEENRRQRKVVKCCHSAAQVFGNPTPFAKNRGHEGVFEVVTLQICDGSSRTAAPVDFKYEVKSRNLSHSFFLNLYLMSRVIHEIPLKCTTRSNALS
jgi:hypothetical protein